MTELLDLVTLVNQGQHCGIVSYVITFVDGEKFAIETRNPHKIISKVSSYVFNDVRKTI